MEKSSKDKILAKIKRAPKGKLFILSDFSNLGSDGTIRKTLHEIENAGQLKRVYLGIYQKPDFDKFLNVPIPSSPTEIAETIGRKNNWTISPAKNLALNILGLDTQVPNTYDYVSDGPSKEFILENGTKITFRHVTQRESLLHSTSALIVEALKEIGSEKVDDQVLKQIKSKLTDKQLAQLEKDTKYTRVWIREKIKRMIEML